MKALKNHIKLQHEKSFTPRTCGRDYAGCIPGKVFQTRKEFDKHCQKHQKQFKDWVRMRCPMPDCTHPTQFQNYGSLSVHVKKVHKVPPKPATFYIKQQQQQPDKPLAVGVPMSQD